MFASSGQKNIIALSMSSSQAYILKIFVAEII